MSTRSFRLAGAAAAALGLALGLALALTPPAAQAQSTSTTVRAARSAAASTSSLTATRSASSRALATATGPTTLMWSQTVLLDGTSTSAAKLGPIVSSQLGFGATHNLLSVSGHQVATLPALGLGSATQPESFVQSTLNSWIGQVKGEFRAKVAAYLQRNGVSQAFFSFTQQVKIASGAPAGFSRKSVVWTGTVMADGRVFAGDPRIIDSDPIFVEAIYWPLAADDTLPAGWTYANAGSIQWRLLDKLMNPISAYAYVSTGGIYDGVVGESYSGEGPAACFIDRRNPGCPASGVDVAQLMTANGASGAVAMYANKLEPKYRPDPAGDGTTFIPVMSYSYTDRLWACDRLENKGQFGYVLQGAADTYFVGSSTTGPVPFQLASASNMEALSPTADFDVSASAAQISAAGLAPEGLIISPVADASATQPILWRFGSTEWNQAVYIAPIRQVTTDSVTFSGPADLSISTVAAGGSQTVTVASPTRYVGVHVREITFNVSDPAALGEMALIAQGFDDQMLLEVNGHAIFAGPRHIFEAYNPLSMLLLGEYVPYGDGMTGLGVHQGTGCMDFGYGASCYDYTTIARVATSYVEQCIEYFGCFPTPVNSYYGIGNTYQELGTWFTDSKYIDFRRWLVPGTNRIRVSLGVRGAGASWFQLRVKGGCGGYSY